jgi:hypothetical protein
VPDLQGKGQIVADAHVGIEGVALEDHGDIAVAWRQSADLLIVDIDLALGHVVETGEHVQRGALAAPRRPNQRHELPIRNLQVQIPDRLDFAVPFGDAFEPH